MPVQPMLRAALLLSIVVAATATPVTGQASDPPLTVSIDDVTWSYGPESWKQDPRSLQSLGTRLDITANVSKDGQATPPDWDYEATLTDGQTTLTGQTAYETDQIHAWFDVDGSRSGLQATVAGLAPGTWRLRIEAYSGSEVTGREPQGTGTATLAAAPVSFVSLLDRNATDPAAVPGGPVPAGTLPGITETGGTPTWFADPMLRVGDAWEAVVATGRPGATVDWTAWRPTTGLPDPDALPEPDALPAGPAMFEETPMGTSVTDGDGVARLQFGAPGHTTLMAIAGVVADAPGGAAVFVVGTGAEGPAITGVQAPQGGQGPVQVALSGMTTGTLHAIRGGQTLATGAVVPTGADQGRGFFDPTPVRSAAVPGYRLLALPGGDVAPYTGHGVLARGLDVTLEVPLLGVDRPGAITAAFHNAGAGTSPDLAMQVDARLMVDETDAGNASFHLPPGGTLRKAWSVAPTHEGTLQVAVVVDTGDLLFEVRSAPTVVSAGEYDRAQASWYEPGRYTPVGTPVALAAVAVAALVARQHKR